MNRRLLLESLLNSKPQLAAPVISLDNDNLVIEEVENAEYYDIYVDDVLEESVPAVEPTPTVFNNITISASTSIHWGDLGGEVWYKLNDGEWIALNDGDEVVLNNVSKLEISGTDNVGENYCAYGIYDENGNDVLYEGDLVSFEEDITQYLGNGYSIELFA